MRHSAEYSQEEAGRYSHKVRFPHNLLNSPTIEWNLVSFWRFSGGKGGHVGHAGLGDILKSQISSHFFLLDTPTIERNLRISTSRLFSRHGEREKFSKVRFIVSLSRNLSKNLTFEKFRL